MESKDDTSGLRAASFAAKTLGLLNPDLKKRNEWKKRMLCTQHGMFFPDDWDSLPEMEKERRLDKAIDMGLTIENENESTT